MEPDSEPESKGRRKPKQRITITPADEAAAGQPPEDQVPVPVAESAALVPTADEMLAILANVKSLDDMRDLQQKVAAWEGLKKRFKAANDEIVRIATVRLRLERMIGEQLAQTVKWGGRRSRSPRGTLNQDGLPDGISKQRASKYREIASIPEEVFDAYVRECELRGKPPSSRALRNSVAKQEGGGEGKRKVRAAPAAEKVAQQEPASSAQPGLTPEIIDAISRLLDVGVVVGEAAAAWPSAVHVDEPDTLKTTQLQGNVVVAFCPDPGEWLPKLAAARANGKVSQVVVLLPAEPWAPWFKEVERGGWMCCFTRSRAAVGYVGKQWHGFKVAFDELGSVLGPGGP